LPSLNFFLDKPTKENKQICLFPTLKKTAGDVFVFFNHLIKKRTGIVYGMTVKFAVLQLIKML